MAETNKHYAIISNRDVAYNKVLERNCLFNFQIKTADAILLHKYNDRINSCIEEYNIHVRRRKLK